MGICNNIPKVKRAFGFMSLNSGACLIAIGSLYHAAFLVSHCIWFTIRMHKQGKNSLHTVELTFVIISTLNASLEFILPVVLLVGIALKNCKMILVYLNFCIFNLCLFLINITNATNVFLAAWFVTVTYFAMLYVFGELKFYWKNIYDYLKVYFFLFYKAISIYCWFIVQSLYQEMLSEIKAARVIQRV